jgi:uncharacterized protein YkwD
MCTTGAVQQATVAGAAGGAAATHAAGGCGAPPQQSTDAAKETVQQDAKQVGGAAGGAVEGAAQVPGNDLAGVLDKLTSLLDEIKNLIASLGAKPAVEGGGGGCGMSGCGGADAAKASKVMGEYGSVQLDASRAGGSYQVSGEDDGFEAAIVRLVNEHRARHGLAPLVYHAALDTVAENHATHQSNVRKMAHGDIGDGTSAERIRSVGWNGAWGENVAVGQTSAQQVVSEWIASPSHNRNLLDPNFSYIGVGINKGADGRLYFAQEFGN